jgi:hypothetical protein
VDIKYILIGFAVGSDNVPVDVGIYPGYREKYIPEFSKTPG